MPAHQTVVDRIWSQMREAQVNFGSYLNAPGCRLRFDENGDLTNHIMRRRYEGEWLRRTGCITIRDMDGNFVRGGISF